MDNDLYQQLKRNRLMFEQAGMPDEVEKIDARLAEADQSEEPEPEPEAAAPAKASGKSKAAPKEA